VLAGSGSIVSLPRPAVVGNGWAVSVLDVGPTKSKKPDRNPRPAIAQTLTTPVATTGNRTRKMSLFSHTQEWPYVGRHEPSSLLNDEGLRVRHGQTS